MTKLDKRLLAEQRQYFQPPSCHFQLTGLYDELTAATNTLTLAISTTICKHTTNLVRQEAAHILQDIANPLAGVYSLTSLIPRPRSAVVVTAQAEIDELQESFLVIKWEDKGDTTDTVTDFEVQYSEERGQSVHWPAKMGSGIKLGKEKVKPGMPHTIRVRKINESGPGPWSKSIIVHMPGTPSRPSQPRIELTSHEQGILTVRRLSQEEEHGSPAKALIIETCTPPSKEWTSREVEINPNMGHSIQADVDVEPDIKQHLRVKMKNGAGISAPSEILKLTPSQMIL